MKKAFKAQSLLFRILMHPRPVAADRHSLFNLPLYLLIGFLCFGGLSLETARAQPSVDVGSGLQALGYLARIQQDSPEDVKRALLRAEELYIENEIPEGFPPIAIVLHGPEVAIFFKQNYKIYKPIVDLAARLTAFGVIDVSVCQTRMGVLGQDPSGLFPFVKTVPFGPLEVERLLNQKEYVYF